MANGWTPLVLAPADHHEHTTTSAPPMQLRQRSTTMPTTQALTARAPGMAPVAQPVLEARHGTGEVIQVTKMAKTPTSSTAVTDGGEMIQVTKMTKAPASSTAAVDKTHRSKSATPFDQPLPGRVSQRFIDNTPVGDRYALYTLVPLTDEKTAVLVDFIVSNTAAEDWSTTVVPAPTHDFSDVEKNSLRDVYDYHTSLLEVVQSNPFSLRPHHFLVAASQDWEVDGILLVNLDCNPYRPGEIGITRLPVGMVGSSLMLLENDPSSWYDFKVGEADTEWPRAIVGYSGSEMHRPGGEWFRSYAHDVMGGELRI